jgi:hypothetical protein
MKELVKRDVRQRQEEVAGLRNRGQKIVAGRIDRWEQNQIVWGQVRSWPTEVGSGAEAESQKGSWSGPGRAKEPCLTAHVRAEKKVTAKLITN